MLRGRIVRGQRKQSQKQEGICFKLPSKMPIPRKTSHNSVEDPASYVGGMAPMIRASNKK